MDKIKIIESDGRKNELMISTGKEFSDILYKLQRKDPRVVIIELPHEGTFTLGIGSPYGFVQFSKDGEPPYLVASANNSETTQSDEIEYDSGGTPTPIPKNLCIPYEKVVDIMVYFFNNKEIPGFIQWVKI